VHKITLDGESLGRIVDQPEVQELYGPMFDGTCIRRMIRERAHQDDGVVTFDLSGFDRKVQQFIPYYLFPRSNYTVGVADAESNEDSVGSNPWAPQEITTTWRPFASGSAAAPSKSGHQPAPALRKPGACRASHRRLKH